MKARPSRIPSAFACLATLAGAAPTQAAQSGCGDPIPGFGTPDVLPAPLEMLAHDDGSGPALYLAGLDGVGNTPVHSLLRWDGAAYSEVGGGVRGEAHALCVFDAGNGPELYAGGIFDFAGGVLVGNVARWDGSSWHALSSGIDGAVYELAVFDDGTGPALFAGGRFDFAGGVPASNVARWDGAAWSALGAGVDGSDRAVYAMDVFTGPMGASSLYVAGDFLTAGGVTANNIAAWDGTGWSVLAGSQTGTSDTVRDLAVWDPPGVPPLALYLCGTFATAGGLASPRIARWRGTNWTPVGMGAPSADLHEMFAFDDGSGTGEALFVCGTLSLSSPGSQVVAKWLGSTWASATLSGGGSARSLATFDDGSGSKLYLGARSNSTLSPSCLYTRTPSSWDPVVLEANAQGANGVVETLGVYAGADGDQVVAGGSFTRFGQTDNRGVALWDGGGWSALGGGIEGTVHAFATFDENTGGCKSFFAAGLFATAGGQPIQNIARFDGANWSDVGGGTSGVVRALCVYDQPGPVPPMLHIGGEFLTVGGQALNNIARWDGTSWGNVGSIGFPDGVYCMTVFDGELFVGGRFIDSGSGGQAIPTRGISRWNGVTHATLGSGVGGGNGIEYPFVNALVVFDDGSGPSLVVGGAFSYAGGVPMRNVARWDGREWSALGSGIPSAVKSLVVWDDGTGPALYAGLEEVAEQSQLVSGAYLLRWTGSGWGPAPNGVISHHLPTTQSADRESRITSLLALEEDDGASSLWIGGRFTMTGNVPALNIGRLSACVEPTGIAYCFGDGSLSTPCPCTPPDTVPNPSGAAGHGCANSFDLDGARLNATGDTANDDVVLRVHGVLPNAFTQFVRGDASNASGIAVGDGVRCVDGTLVRFGGQFAACGVVQYPRASSADLALSAVSGTSIGSGATRYYQALYRDAQPGFCGRGIVNMTNAYGITW